MDGREFPSIYVGESARSLSERAAEHWSDFRVKEEDSHMLKHWMLQHGGQGEPRFRFEVVKFCGDALTRQVGEATRISLRENCLNSKAGYNRSGISRLALKPEDEPSIKPGGASSRMEREEQDGIETLMRRVHDRARKVFKRPSDCQNHNPKSRKRKKLAYEVLDVDWGLEFGELQSGTDSGPLEQHLDFTPTEKPNQELKLPETNKVRSPEINLMKESTRKLNSNCYSAQPTPPAKKKRKWGKKKSGLYGWVPYTPERKKTAETINLEVKPRGVGTPKSKETLKTKISGARVQLASEPEQKLK